MNLSAVTAQGLRLALWDHAPGRADLPTVLCVHGALDTGRSFDALAQVLQAQARVVAVDLRGHGSSQRVGAGGSYHLLDFLKDLAFVVEHLGRIDVLVGHSMGANLALLLVGALPSCAQSLLLVDGVGPPGEEGSEQPERLGELLRTILEPEREFIPMQSLDAGIARLRRWNPGLSELGARRMLEHVLVPRVEGGFDFPFDPRLRGPTPFRFTDDTWRACCARVGVKTTILRASHGYVPAGEVEGTLGAPFDERARLLKAKVVVVDGGHHLHVDHPAALAAAVHDLL